MKKLPLEGVRVLDITRVIYGPWAATLLALLGAEVIRIEPPEGDIARKFTPENLKIDGTGLAYFVESRNKYHITLNVEKERGREILRKLVERSDVLIHTFPRDYVESIGIDYEDLKDCNPKLIYCSIHTHGYERGFSFGDYDVIAQAMSGFSYTTGIPENYEEFPEHTRVPTKMGNWMGWYAGGAFAALSILAALISREVTGEGCLIDLSPAEALMCLNNYALHFYHLTGKVIERTANFEPAAYAYNYFRAKDGMVFIAGYTDPNWKALCSIIGREDLVEKYPTIKDRTNPDNWIPMTREIEKFTMKHTRKELLELWLSYKGEGVTVAGEVLKPIETMEFNHWYERAALIKLRGGGKDLVVQGVCQKMSGTPPRVKWFNRKVGEDNSLIYRKLLGLDDGELKRLREEGVV